MKARASLKSAAALVVGAVLIVGCAALEAPPTPGPPTDLPPHLPVPVDDGACDHLPGTAVPSQPLWATTGELVDPAALPGRTVMYCYPRTGRPGEDLPPEWDAIPGARGCTAQACDLRDHAQEFQRLGARVVGLSVQTPDEQAEAAQRLRLPFPLLSDAKLQLATALALPTFRFQQRTLLKRATLIVDDGIVTHCFYPVFPPDAHAEQVLQWLQEHQRAPKA